MRPLAAIGISTAITLVMGAAVTAGLAFQRIDRPTPRTIVAPQPQVVALPIDVPQLLQPPVEVPQPPVEVRCCACAMEDNRRREQLHLTSRRPTR